MFKVRYKETNEMFEVYDIRYDAISGYPQFLIYQNNQWLMKSAKHFKPIENKKILNESTKNYTFEDGM